jgi:excisionase family DNA binding protein
VEEVLTLAEAADRLAISSRTARRWIHAGVLAAELRPGRHGPEYEVPLAAVAALRERRLNGAGHPALLPETRAGEPVQEALSRTWREVTLMQQELWRTCQELAEAREEMQRLRAELAATRRAIRGRHEASRRRSDGRDAERAS